MSREQMIKEARTIEAMKKGYMGLEGKFSLIAKCLGQPIIHQGGRCFEQTFLDDPYEIEDPEEILTMEEEENSYEIGIQFDGLSRGINMTISVQYHLREITCRYQGQIVYKESSGELEGYVPDIWEEQIENLYQIAKRIERQKRPEERKRIIAENQKKKNEVLNYLRSKWGL